MPPHPVCGPEKDPHATFVKGRSVQQEAMKETVRKKTKDMTKKRQRYGKTAFPFLFPYCFIK